MTRSRKKRKDELEQFKEWLSARGAEVLVPTNEWELVRFRGDGATSIIYTSKTGSRTHTGRAFDAWTAFKAGDNSFRLSGRAQRPSQNKRKRTRDAIVNTIIARDGDFCFYCGDPFGDELQRTKEHLVGRTHNGPEHLSNLFLACPTCNVEAGHMSAPEKIRLRDRKRRGRGSQLLARVFDRFFGGEGDPALLDDIKTFLHEQDGTEPPATQPHLAQENTNG